MKAVDRDGAPCWVDTMQPDPNAACAFYSALLDWGTVKCAPAGGEPVDDEQFIARLRGQRVAGIRKVSPDTGSAQWITYVRVRDVELTLELAVTAGGSCLTPPQHAYFDKTLAMVGDPTGVRFGLLQGGDGRAAEVVNEPGAWAMSSLHTTHPEQAHHFYASVFGWHLDTTRGAPFSRWHLGGEVVALMSVTDGSSVPPHWSINFTVTDTDAIAERATTLGGTVMMPPFNTSGYRNAVLADPQGGVIAISARCT